MAHVKQLVFKCYALTIRPYLHFRPFSSLADEFPFYQLMQNTNEPRCDKIRSHDNINSIIFYQFTVIVCLNEREKCIHICNNSDKRCQKKERAILLIVCGTISSFCPQSPIVSSDPKVSR